MSLTKAIYKIPDPVQWHEGLLIHPQHFQEMRNELKQLSLCYLSMASPYYWGQRRLKIDDTALAAGILSITEILAVMPLGCVIWKDETSTRTIEIDLKPYKDQMEGGKELKVHLGIIKAEENSKLVGGEYARYDVVDEDLVVDENTGENPINVARLALKIFLLVGDDIPSRYSTFPLLGITNKDDVFMKTDFIPPSTNLRKGGPIASLCAPLLKSLRTRIGFLSERLQAPYNQDTAGLIDKYEKIYGIICGRLLSLEALVNSEGSHPYMIYKELCGTAGVFSSLNLGQLPPIFAPYDHNDLRASFRPIFEYINKTLESVKNPCASSTFEKRGRVFSHNIIKEWVEQGYLVLGIRLGADITFKNAAAWVEGAVIISESLVNGAKEKRILGAVRYVVDQVPDMGLTMSRDKILVKVEIDPLTILANEPLQIFNLSDTEEDRPSEIVLYTIA